MKTPMTQVTQWFAFGAMALSLLGPCTALAQSWPAKPLRIVSTFGAGSVADGALRMVAQKMGDSIGQPVVVEVQAGAGGVVGAQVVARAAPDGYTLLHTIPTSVVATPLLMKSPPFEFKDFTPITFAIDGATSMLVAATVPVNSVKELIEYIRARPGKLAYGSNGVGGSYHLEMEMLKQSFGLDITHVPYKGGQAALMAAVAGDVPVAFAPTASAMVQQKAGKVKVLSVMDVRRFPDVPEIPAMPEQVPGYEKTPSGLDIYGPAGMPPQLVKRLFDEIAKAVRNPEVAKRLKDIAFYPVLMPTEEFAALRRKDIDLMARAIKIAGLKPE
jgi:tripartite-type tricarboxylate transporter receptor subunit TctC